jgi:hypothetical protein
MEQAPQLGEEPLQPGAERRVAIDAAQRPLVLGADLRPHRVDVLHVLY